MCRAWDEIDERTELLLKIKKWETGVERVVDHYGVHVDDPRLRESREAFISTLCIIVSSIVVDQI